jgi:hypothetical protein
MALQAHIRELRARHQTLDRAIEQEAARPAADAIRLKDLKRKKLKLKEALEALGAGDLH